jgi:prevent-host-death family protein
MSKRVSASDAKNNFGGLLDDVAALGRVEIVKHGRLVAVVLSPQALASVVGGRGRDAGSRRAEKHMIPPDKAAAARVIRAPGAFDEE